MSDPLSVAGSAVGVISLGLVVCGEIVDYGRAYRDYDEDIRNITAKAEALSETLEALEDALQCTQATHPKVATVLSKKVIGMKKHILRLEDMLKRYGPDKSVERFVHKARNQAKRTMYVFRKDAFREMTADLDSLQGDLQTALLVSFARYSWKQELELLQEIKHVKMLLTREDGKIPPSLLKDCCEVHETRQNELTGSSNRSLDFHRIKQEQRYRTRSHRFYSSWLSRAIEVSFNMTTGAGGFSIYPSLRVQRILLWGTPEYHQVQSLLFSLDRGDNFENDFQALKSSLSDRTLDLLCVIEHGQSIIPLFEQFFKTLARYAISSSTDLQRSRILEFLQAIRTESGHFDYSLSIGPYGLPLLSEKDVLFIMRLVKIGFKLDFSASCFTFEIFAKNNLLLLLPQPESLLQIPESIKLICCECAVELRLALQEKRILPNERVGSYSMLQWTIGWPEGAQILLEYGADPRQDFALILLNPGKRCQRWVEVLLRAGCSLDPVDLKRVFQFNNDEERMKSLVNELATRRKKLRHLAEKFVPLYLIPGYGENKLPDGSDCHKILKLLSDCKIPLPQCFMPRTEQFLSLWGDQTVYHNLVSARSARALHQAGFLDTDEVASNGFSPLGSLSISAVADTPDELTEIIQWHISKGANLHRALPWTNESVAHLLILMMVERGFWHSGRDDHFFHLTRLERYLQELIAMGDYFFAPTGVSDGCSCPCSSNGCTAASTILRELTCERRPYDQCSHCQRRVFEFLQEWDQSYGQDPRAYIRSLTFNALNLTHTCFSRTPKGYVVWNNCGIHPAGRDTIDTCDGQSLLDGFEDLLGDLEKRFVELGQPLKDFLPEYWYRHVKDHLLTRQPDDEKHLKGARSLGVGLEFCGLSVPDWMETCIARKVEELNDEGAVNLQRG